MPRHPEILEVGNRGPQGRGFEQNPRTWCEENSHPLEFWHHCSGYLYPSQTLNSQRDAYLLDKSDMSRHLHAIGTTAPPIGLAYTTLGSTGAKPLLFENLGDSLRYTEGYGEIDFPVTFCSVAFFTSPAAGEFILSGGVGSPAFGDDIDTELRLNGTVTPGVLTTTYVGSIAAYWFCYDGDDSYVAVNDDSRVTIDAATQGMPDTNLIASGANMIIGSPTGSSWKLYEQFAISHPLTEEERVEFFADIIVPRWSGTGTASWEQV